MKDIKSHLSLGGSFVSISEMFKSADSGVKYAPKIEVQVRKTPNSTHPYGFDYIINTHKLLLDLDSIDADQFDTNKVIKDCELVINACKENPKKVRSILDAFADDASTEKKLEALKTADALGISELAAIKAGGGMLWLAILVAAAILLYPSTAE